MGGGVREDEATDDDRHGQMLENVAELRAVLDAEADVADDAHDAADAAASAAAIAHTERRRKAAIALRVTASQSEKNRVLRLGGASLLVEALEQWNGDSRGAAAGAADTDGKSEQTDGGSSSAAVVDGEAMAEAALAINYIAQGGDGWQGARDTAFVEAGALEALVPALPFLTHDGHRAACYALHYLINLDASHKDAEEAGLDDDAYLHRRMRLRSYPNIIEILKPYCGKKDGDLTQKIIDILKATAAPGRMTKRAI